MKNIKINKSIAAVLIMLVILIFVTQSDKVWLLWTPQLRPERFSSRIEEPNRFTSALTELNPVNFEQASEITIFRLSESNKQVVAISEDSNQKWIMAIDVQGTFVHWEMTSQQMVAKFDFYSAFPGSTNFSEDGSRLIAGGGAVWDTKDGKMIFCPAKCTDLSLLYEDALSILDPSGTLMITNGRIHISEIDGRKLHGAITYLHSDCLFTGPEGPVPGVKLVTVDLSDTYLAYILTNGVICVREINDLLGYDLKTGDALTSQQPTNDGRYTHLSSGQLRYDLPGEKVGTADMVFDPTRRWLATVTDKELAVWNLDNLFFPRQVYTSINDGNTISFDRTGNLLALGTKHGIVIYDVVRRLQIAEFKVGEVTALYFTRDNRLLVWGDSEGNIHLWGVK